MFYALISLNRTRFFVNSSGCLKMYTLPALQEDSGLPKLKFCGAANSSSWYSLSCVWLQNPLLLFGGIQFFVNFIFWR